MSRQTNLHWLGDAACATADGSPNPLFFPQDNRGASPAIKAQIKAQVRAAKRICDGEAVVVAGPNGEAIVKWGTPPCPVKAQCLALAMDNEKGNHRERDGIFGAMTPMDRWVLQQQRDAAAEALEAAKPVVLTLVGRKCTAPGTDRGAGKHLQFGETPCAACAAFAISPDQEEHVRGMVEGGEPNYEIFRRTTVHSATVHAIRVLLDMPDPARRGGTGRHFSEEAAAARQRSYDPVKVERWIDGDRKIRLTRLERFEMLRRVLALGLTDVQIGERYYSNPDQVRRDRNVLGLPFNKVELNPVSQAKARNRGGRKDVAA